MNLRRILSSHGFLPVPMHRSGPLWWSGQSRGSTANLSKRLPMKRRNERTEIDSHANFKMGNNGGPQGSEEGNPLEHSSNLRFRPSLRVERKVRVPDGSCPWGIQPVNSSPGTRGGIQALAKWASISSRVLPFV